MVRQARRVGWRLGRGTSGTLCRCGRLASCRCKPATAVAEQAQPTAVVDLRAKNGDSKILHHWCHRRGLMQVGPGGNCARNAAGGTRRPPPRPPPPAPPPAPGAAGRGRRRTARPRQPPGGALRRQPGGYGAAGARGYGAGVAQSPGFAVRSETPGGRGRAPSTRADMHAQVHTGTRRHTCSPRARWG